ncbi:MAG TPA: GNAT family N-acetyltransferase [Euzebya sp.]|nr:GNAT family N-acetyltransferase [Euzebya sp.]
MGMTIRLVTPAEHGVVGRLTLAAYDAVGTMSPRYRAEMADTAGRVADGAAVWVAVDTDTGEMLGAVSFVDRDNPHFEAPEVGDCGFRMLAVAPAAQGRGVGRALVQHCIDHATALGRHRLAIHTMEWMVGAQAMYSAMGFVRRPDRDVVFPGGPGRVFQRDLTTGAASHFPPPGPIRDPLPWFEDLWAEREAAEDLQQGC